MGFPIAIVSRCTILCNALPNPDKDMVLRMIDKDIQRFSDEELESAIYLIALVIKDTSLSSKNQTHLQNRRNMMLQEAKKRGWNSYDSTSIGTLAYPEEL